MILFLREMKRNRKSFVIWIACLLIYNIFVFALYPTFADPAAADAYKQMIESMPKQFLAMLNAEQLDFSNILSYYGTYSYLYFILAGSIYAMIFGAGILSKEESDKTIEFLISKPITRSSIVTSKICCAFIYLFLFNFIYSVSTYILVQIYHKASYSSTALWLMLTGPFIVFFIFAAIGLVISVFIVKAKSIFPIAIGTAMGTFILGGVSAITDKAAWLKYISPFKYVDSSEILKAEKIDLKYIIIFIIVTAISVVSTYYFYNRKDMTT